jgi:hypothetical protein
MIWNEDDLSSNNINNDANYIYALWVFFQYALAPVSTKQSERPERMIEWMDDMICNDLQDQPSWHLYQVSNQLDILHLLYQNVGMPLIIAMFLQPKNGPLDKGHTETKE